MHPSVVVDASVWASLLMPPDPNHAASLAWSNRYITAGGLIIVPEFMMVELAAALVRQTNQPTFKGSLPIMLAAISSGLILTAIVGLIAGLAFGPASKPTPSDLLPPNAPVQAPGSG